MAKIIQYIPKPINGEKEEVAEFKSVTELLEIPFVKTYSFSPELFGKVFHQFSFADYSKVNSNKRYILMAEYESGMLWYVVGFTNENEIIKSLPKWTEVRI